MKPELNDICLIAKQAGQIAKAAFGKDHHVTQKGAQDPVTEIDKQTETFILDQLFRRYPTHSILSEETGLHIGSADADYVWYIDPLDGTMNYSHNIPCFSVSMGCAYRGELMLGVIYDPMRDEIFYAEKGHGAFCNGQTIHVSKQTELRHALLTTGFSIKLLEMGRDNFSVFRHLMCTTAGVRRMGSAALEIAYVGAGRLDGMWEMRLSAWDVAAGFVIAQEAGAMLSDLAGNPDCFVEPYEYVLSNPTLHPLLVAEIQDVMNRTSAKNPA